MVPWGRPKKTCPLCLLLRGTQKRQKRAHEKPTITLVGSVCFGAVEIAIKKHLPTLDANKAKLKIGSRNSNENHS
jgi:hypothetical protein